MFGSVHLLSFILLLQECLLQVSYKSMNVHSMGERKSLDVWKKKDSPDLKSALVLFLLPDQKWTQNTNKNKTKKLCTYIYHTTCLDVRAESRLLQYTGGAYTVV